MINMQLTAGDDCSVGEETPLWALVRLCFGVAEKVKKVPYRPVYLT